jgi:hypothetical protein
MMSTSTFARLLELLARDAQETESLSIKLSDARREIDTLLGLVERLGTGVSVDTPAGSDVFVLRLMLDRGMVAASRSKSALADATAVRVREQLIRAFDSLG